MANREWAAVLIVPILLLLAPTRAAAWRGSDEAVFQSYPSGANVYLDGQLIGQTPIRLSVPCDEVVDRPYRIEHTDCDPQEGIIYARPAPGRIVGMVFSFGITSIFQCPNYFVPVAATLAGGSCAVPPQGAYAVQPQADGLTERLRTLKDLHDRGVLSDAEYERERATALGGL